MRKMITTIGVGAGILIMAGCASAHSAIPRSSHSAAPKASASSVQPVPVATVAPIPAPPSMAQRVTKWWHASGRRDANRVDGDIQAMGQDASALSVSRVESDGYTLAQDANTARTDGAPGRVGIQWRAAMLDYERSGNLAATGDFPDATSYMQLGTRHISLATAAIQRLGG